MIAMADGDRTSNVEAGRGQKRRADSMAEVGGGNKSWTQWTPIGIQRWTGWLQGPQTQFNGRGPGPEHMIATAGGDITSDVETGRDRKRGDESMAKVEGRTESWTQRRPTDI